MSKGDSNLNFLKTQTCVLKVNICCDGCKIKVKKLLQKIDGVYTINIDSEKGKVTVSGSASPAALIKKLCKAGKHAELVGPRSGSSSSDNKNSAGAAGSNFHEQLQKLQLQQKGNGNPPKAGGGGGKEQKGQQLLQQMKGFQDLKFPPQKDQKNVKFTFPSEDEDGSDFDEDDFYDSEDDLDDYDDDDFDDFGDDHKHSKAKPTKEKGGGGGKNDKKGGGGGVSMLNKLTGSIGGGKKDSRGGGGCGHKDGKNGGDKNKKGAPNGNGKDNNNGGKKGGGAQPMAGAPSMGHPMNLSAGGMPPGYYQGGMAAPAAAAAANPYQQQQQYMAAMQQRMMMNGQMHCGQQPMMGGYGQPTGHILPLPPAYGEPAYTHYFSDENPNSCSVM